jgi:superfamily II DNA or RNA helicase
MNIEIASLGVSIKLSAASDGLLIKSDRTVDWGHPESWPSDSLEQSSGRRTAYEVASLLEMRLAQVIDAGVLIPYANFEAAETEEFRITTAFAKPSPFLLKIDRAGDLGRPDFRYKYQFLIGGAQVPLERTGYFVQRASTGEVFRLDPTMFSLLEAMDTFNDLPPESKKPERAWLDFAHIKEWATDTKATLDSTLLKNDVVVPSSIGLDIYETDDGAMSFVPTCPELDNAEFRTVFDRNNSAQGFYSLDRPGLGKLRIVLTDRQIHVLERMKRVRRVTGERKEQLKIDPTPVFDGILGDVELPYSDRVIGIGKYEFAPVPRADGDDSSMSALWREAGLSEGANGPSSGVTKTSEESERPSRLSLLIETNEDHVRGDYLKEAELASEKVDELPMETPISLAEGITLKQHQKEGVSWLQSCTRISGRAGVLLADDMGVGKTLQILTFLAWCIESGRFTDLSRPKPPFRPILIVAPLMLLETETWQREMKKFFLENGEVFGNVLPLYGYELKAYRRKDLAGKEDYLARPTLDIERIRRNHVVITNYEAVRDYEFSFAYCPNGQSIWSIVITDEAHEYKTPNSRISHAIKALKPDFRIACTGTPVENRLLDLWNLFDATQPGLLGSAREFSAFYERRMDDDRKAKAFLELKGRLLYQKSNAFLLRRSKADVLELPAKHEHRVQCSMSPQEIAVHQGLVNGLQGAKENKGKLALLHRFARMYQHPLMVVDTGDEISVPELLRTSSKLRAVVAELHRIRGLREKVIVFARHKDVQRMLARVFWEEFSRPVRIINGETPRNPGNRSLNTETRSGILDAFRQSKGFDALILSPFVAGVGLTIVEANHVIHYGRWWNPAVESQATDRVYRLGQTKEVHVYFPMLHDLTHQVSPTFDQLLDALMEDKKGLAEGALKKDNFLRPRMNEDELGLKVFAGLEQSVGIAP